MGMANSKSVTSSGVVTGDNPLQHALLLLMLQIALIITLTRFVALVLRPLKHPSVWLASFPFHEYFCHDENLETTNSGFQHVNAMILQHSPCSVGIMLDGGFGGLSIAPHVHLSASGRPDDREALMLARRMSQHHGVKFTVIQCLIRSPKVEGIQRLTSNTLLEQHLPSKQSGFVNLSAAMKHRLALLRLGMKTCHFSQAPWHSSQRPDLDEQKGKADSHTQARLDNQASALNAQICTTSVGANGRPLAKSGAAHLKLENENEKKLDMQALAPLLAASKASERESRLAGNDTSIGFSSRDPDRSLDDSGLHYSNQNEGLKVWDMEDPYKPVVEVAGWSDFVGLHVCTGTRRAPFYIWGRFH